MFFYNIYARCFHHPNSMCPIEEKESVIGNLKFRPSNAIEKSYDQSPRSCTHFDVVLLVVIMPLLWEKKEKGILTEMIRLKGGMLK